MGKKQRYGKWKKTQEQLFDKALNKYGKNWMKISQIIKTRSVSQIRSHAQKMFNSMTKRQRKMYESDINKRLQDFCQPKLKNQSIMEYKKYDVNQNDKNDPIVSQQPKKQNEASKNSDKSCQKYTGYSFRMQPPCHLSDTCFHQQLQLRSSQKANSNPNQTLMTLLGLYIQKLNQQLSKQLMLSNQIINSISNKTYK